MDKNLALMVFVFGLFLVTMAGSVIAVSDEVEVESYININDVKLNESKLVTTNPNGTVNVTVNVTATGNDNWHSTAYKVNNYTWNCVNVPDPDVDDGTYIRSFLVNAPLSAGNYSFSVIAYNHNNCSDGSIPYTIPGNSTHGIHVVLPPPVPPICSVDYITNKNSLNLYNFSNSIYVDEVGKFYIYGNASAFNGSTIANVQYNRTSPDIYFHYTDADPTDGLFNQANETWRSKPNDPDQLVNGNHTICCRAADSLGNVQNPGSCQTFCIDTEQPGTPNVTVNNQFLCTPGYTNLPISFSWNAVNSNGCSPMENYEVALYYSNGTLIGNYSQANNTFAVPSPQSGKDYYIQVRANDSAGNLGNWSSPSQEVWYDVVAPNVSITAPPAGSWFNADFNVSETDSDDTGLYLCQYLVKNNGAINLNWTNTPCNQNVTVDISQYCPQDGSCAVDKQAQDNACNWEGAWKKTYFIDRTPPNTTKFVGLPKVAPFTPEWISQLVNGFFVRGSTPITLTCSDAGIGCDMIYYNITYNGTTSQHAYNVTEEESNSAVLYLNQGDGLYNLTYFSTDKLGNKESLHYEVDKVDTIPPSTIKTVGSQNYTDSQGRFWISGATQLTLLCSDNEVGCNMSLYQIDSGETNYANSSNGTFANFTLGGFGDGEHVIYYWSNDSLGNTESEKSETDWVDTHFPLIAVHNPTGSDAENVDICEQAIVIEARDVMNVTGEGGYLEGGSGLNVSTIKADLLSGEEVIERNITLHNTSYGTYEGVMDKQVPSLLRAYAASADSAYRLDKHSVLEQFAYLNYVCIVDIVRGINPEQVFPCRKRTMQFNICMRGYNGIQFWMNKIGGILTPDNLSATISLGNDSAMVGLKHAEDYNQTYCEYLQNQFGHNYWNGTACWYQSPADTLPLGCPEINGKTSFNLNLNISSQIAPDIGTGELEYWIGPSYSGCYD